MIISQNRLRKRWFSLSSKAIDRKVNRELIRCKFRKKSFAEITFSHKRVSHEDINELYKRLGYAGYYDFHVVYDSKGNHVVLFDVITEPTKGRLE